MTPADDPPPSVGDGKPVVLVVDDDDDVARVFVRALERHGMVVHRARSGTEAVAMIQSAPALAAAIVDLILPGIGGLEVVKALRARHPGCRIVAVTGLGEPAMEQAFRSAGADRFLTKPVDLQALLEAVRPAK
ncbi:MAG: response regulator [Gemmatimonadales bacterium]|nr:response regulator [Gemmatimonadales bacterium]